MVNAENLTSSADRVGKDWLESRLSTVQNELNELKDQNFDDNDKIQITQDLLNWQFAEFLTNDPYVLASLKQKVDDIRKNPDLVVRAWNGLDQLSTFLDDIDKSNEDRMKKDYDEFIKKIETPSKLNSMKSREIRRLNLYLWMNEGAAFKAYELMKPIVWKFAEKNMKSEDQKFFNSVWDTLKANYSENDKFIAKDYPEYKDLKPTKGSLENLVTPDGNSVKDITEKNDSIVNVGKLKEKVDILNQERINANNDIVKAIQIDVGDNLSDFTLEGWEIKYQWEKFTIDKMMELFESRLSDKAENKTEFISNDEKILTIEACKNDIFKNLNDKLSKEAAKIDAIDNKWERMDEERINEINLVAWDNAFLKLDGEKLKYNMDNVKKFLWTINKDNFKNYYTKPWEANRYAWLAATQILLNQSDNNLTVDGEYKRWGETYEAVKKFQENYNLKNKGENEKYPEGFEPLVEDWIPGPKTLAKLLWTPDSWDDTHDNLYLPISDP